MYRVIDKLNKLCFFVILSVLSLGLGYSSTQAAEQLHLIEPCLKEQLRIVKDSVYYTADDLIDPEFFTSGQLESNGALRLYFKTRTRSTGRASKVLRGSEQFSEIFNHFGALVKKIIGEWVSGDNLEKFNQLTGAPLFLNEFDAALQTWTGKNAAKFRYTEVTVKILDGTPGHYKKVIVEFKKPRSY